MVSRELFLEISPSDLFLGDIDLAVQVSQIVSDFSNGIQLA